MANYKSNVKTVRWSEGHPKAKEGRISVQPPQKLISRDDFSTSLMDFDIWLILDGRADFFPDQGAARSLHRGSCLWLAPGRLFDLRVSDGGTLTTAWLHFDILDKARKPYLPSRVQIPPPVNEIYDLQLFESLLRRIISIQSLLPNSEPKARGILESQASRLLSGLLHEYEIAHAEQESPGPAGIQKHHEQMISSALSWLHFHPEKARSSAALAERFGYSLKHFSRIFLEVTGKTPTQMIIHSKIDRAKGLLTDSSMNITEIAESLSYESSFYFSKQFKQVVGVSPLQYRTQMTKDSHVHRRPAR